MSCPLCDAPAGTVLVANNPVGGSVLKEMRVKEGQTVKEGEIIADLRAAGIEVHDFDDRGVFQESGDRRPQGGAQHACAAGGCFRLLMVDRHVVPVRLRARATRGPGSVTSKKGWNWGSRFWKPP